MRLRKTELEKIYTWLVLQITPAMLEAIKEPWPGLYEKLLEKKPPFSVCDFSLDIQIILDAMARRKTTALNIRHDLPKQYLLEIATILGCNTNKKTQAWRILQQILRKIKKEKPPPYLGE